jgi:hypothetical protein
MTDMLSLLADYGVTAKKVAGTHGGEYHSACPVCGGRDRFHCWPQRPSTGTCPLPGVWGCRACDKSGDIIAFLQHAGGLSWKDACARLNIRMDENRPVRLPVRVKAEGIRQAEAKGLPPAIWRERNTKLVTHAHEQLMNTPSVLEYLAGRGLNAEACARYRLGWLPGEKNKSWYTRPLKAWGLPEAIGEKAFRFPRGLVIPRFSQAEGKEEVIGLRIRRTDADRAEFAPEKKYLAFKGGAVTPLLIPAPGVAPSRAVLVIVEAELDAMLVAEVARAAGLPCGAMALVSNTARPDAAAYAACGQAAALLLSLDLDPKAGGGAKATAKAVAKWRATYPNAKDWPVPQGKDPGDAYSAGVDLALWLEAGLPAICLPVGKSTPNIHIKTYCVEHGSDLCGNNAPQVGTVGNSGRESCFTWERGGFSAFVPGPGFNGSGPADWLTHPIGPMDSLRVLARAGLRAELSGDDYKVSGFDQWSGKDVLSLKDWQRQHGAWLRQALRTQSAEVRVSPQSSSSTGRPDECPTRPGTFPTLMCTPQAADEQ